MSYTVYRIERDGTETEIAYIDSLLDYEIVKMEDRDKIDYEAGYRCHNNSDLHDTGK